MSLKEVTHRQHIYQDDEFLSFSVLIALHDIPKSTFLEYHQLMLLLCVNSSLVHGEILRKKFI